MFRVSFSQAAIDALKHERFHHPHPRVQQKMWELWLEACEIPEKRGGIAARSGRRKQGAPGVLVEIHDMQLGVRAVAANVTGEYRDPERDIRRVGSRDESEGELWGTALHVFAGFI